MKKKDSVKRSVEENFWFFLVAWFLLDCQSSSRQTSLVFGVAYSNIPSQIGFTKVSKLLNQTKLDCPRSVDPGSVIDNSIFSFCSQNFLTCIIAVSNYPLIMQQLPLTTGESKSNAIVTDQSSDYQFSDDNKGELSEQTDLHSETVQQVKNKKKRGRRRYRKRPYSARNFLGRPKINAPANTTQFLFADKELDKTHVIPDFDESLGNSENETLTLNNSCSAQTDSLQSTNFYSDNSSYESNLVDDDTFINEEFAEVYDRIRAELLRKESIEELTSKCMELESAVHNLQYLLRKEVVKRQKIEELLTLLHFNKELVEKNNALKEAGLSRRLDQIQSNISQLRSVANTSNNSQET